MPVEDEDEEEEEEEEEEEAEEEGDCLQKVRSTLSDYQFFSVLRGGGGGGGHAFRPLKVAALASGSRHSQTQIKYCPPWHVRIAKKYLEEHVHVTWKK